MKNRHNKLVWEVRRDKATGGRELDGEREGHMINTNRAIESRDVAPASATSCSTTWQWRSQTCSSKGSICRIRRPDQNSQLGWLLDFLWIVIFQNPFCADLSRSPRGKGGYPYSPVLVNAWELSWAFNWINPIKQKFLNMRCFIELFWNRRKKLASHGGPRVLINNPLTPSSD